MYPPTWPTMISPRGWSLPPQAWRLMHLQGPLLQPGAPCDCKVCPLLRRDGYALLAGSLPHNKDETSSLAACVLHGLDDVASTPLSEPTSSLHDDGFPFDRGKCHSISDCCAGPALTVAAKRVMDTSL